MITSTTPQNHNYTYDYRSKKQKKAYVYILEAYILETYILETYIFCTSLSYVLLYTIPLTSKDWGYFLELFRQRKRRDGSRRAGNGLVWPDDACTHYRTTHKGKGGGRPRNRCYGL
jgi:hypothetical protein